MSYLTQSQIAQDSVLSRRIIACAALEGVPNPPFWVGSMMWRFSAQPGWVAAYQAAKTPAGADETAITDSMVLDAVTTLYEPPPASGPPQPESPA